MRIAIVGSRNVIIDSITEFVADNDEIVSGGQTMNPSSEDFIEAFKRLDAENIIVFPNNKNIIMAAKQAAEAYEDANVVVIETKSIAECYSALTMLDYSSDDLNTIVDDFKMVIDNVVDGSITYAIRDSQIDGIDIKKDDFMAFIKGHIVASNPNKVEAVKELFNKVEDIEDKEVALDALKKAKNSGQHMLSIINDILDMARIENGKIEINCILSSKDLHLRKNICALC